MRPKRKKKATKNQKGLAKIEKAVSNLREEYESKYPFAVDYDEVITPEGMPTFEEFVNSKKAGRTYNEADPLYGYTKTTQLPLGLAFQRWRGSKTSKDGKNYRVPYMTPLEIKKIAPKTTGTKFGSGITADGKLTLGAEGIGGVGLDGYKEGHRKQMEKRTFVDKAKGLAGTIFPPLNMLSGGASASGGRNLTNAAYLASLAKAGQIAYNNEKFSDIVPLTGSMAVSQGLLATTPSKAVIPTAGFMINPYNKAVRALKKDSKKSNKELDKKLEKGTPEYNKQLEKEKAEFERQSLLYEKKYGVKPVIPEMTAGFRPAQYKAGDGLRGQNRNPIFLKKGGKMPFIKLKKK